MMPTKRFAVLAGVALWATTLGGCTLVRTITAQTWWGDGSGVYIAYWEGTGMGKGDSKVIWCRIHKDNSLGCKNQADAEAKLNIRGRDKAEKNQ